MEDYQSQEKANISVNNVPAKDICVKAVIDGLIEHKGKEFDFENLFIVEDCIASLDADVFDQYLNDIHNKYNEFVWFITTEDIKD